MLGTPAVFDLRVGIEFAVHARQHLAIDIWLRITFGVVFASSLVLGSRTCLQDSAASFYAGGKLSEVRASSSSSSRSRTIRAT
jgi:hypothetical protein